MKLEIEKLKTNNKNTLEAEQLENHKMAIMEFIAGLRRHHIPNMDFRDKGVPKELLPVPRYDSHYYFFDGKRRLLSRVTSLGHPDERTLDDALFLYIHVLQDDGKTNQVVGVQTRKFEDQVNETEAEMLSSYTPEQFELMVEILNASRTIDRKRYQQLMRI